MVNEHRSSEIRLFLSYNPVKVHVALSIYSRRGQYLNQVGLSHTWQKAYLHLPFPMISYCQDHSHKTGKFPFKVLPSLLLCALQDFIPYMWDCNNAHNKQRMTTSSEEEQQEQTNRTARSLIPAASVHTNPAQQLSRAEGMGGEPRTPWLFLSHQIKKLPFFF